MALKILLKKKLSAFCNYVGFLNLLNSHALRNKAFVLMYHRVLKSPSFGPTFVQPGMYVSVESFRRQLAFLKERFNVIPLDELVKRIETGRNLAKCCSITFDDGWRDTFNHAFPILKNFQLPATVFLATGFIGTNRLFWPEELCYYLQNDEVLSVASQNRALERFLGQLPRKGNEETFLDNAVQTLKLWPPHERNEILKYLRMACNAQPQERHLMNWDEVRSMKASGIINFGSHTTNHVILNQISKSQAEEEIHNSLLDMENSLGECPDFFAYPNGNFNKDIRQILKKNGIRGAFTTQKDYVEDGHDLFALPRIGIHEDVSSTIPLFFSRILLKRF